MNLRGEMALLRRHCDLLDPPPAPPNPLTGVYAGRPVEYAREVLGQDLWAAQEEICRKILEPPYKVLAKACHTVGKTHTAACLVNWWFDTYDPSWCITTAPTHRDVCDLLWSEVRRLRAGKHAQWGHRGGFRGSAAPELGQGEHYAKGFTAAKGESFQGRHRERMLFLFDEAVGIAPVFWDTLKSMFQPTGQHHVVCTFNPTDTASQAYAEEMRGGWHVVTMSAPAHPNLAAELEGLPRPVASAVSLAQFEMWLHDWCEPIAPKDATATDLQWPPEAWRQQHAPGAVPKWHRPGPLMECRGLGKWPSQATYGVWSDWAWECAAMLLREPPPGSLPRLGCDVAVHGDDYTAIMTQAGGVALNHERHNGWEPDRTAGRLKQLCQEAADWFNHPARLDANAQKIRPQDIPVNIDADGPGWGVLSHRGDYLFLAVQGNSPATNQSEYFNRRSENWFSLAKRAKRGLVSFARLGEEDRRRLRLQLMAPRWAPNSGGQCQVEKKADTKKRLPSLGSPDDADAANLAFYEAPRQSYHAVGSDRKPAKQAAGDWRQLEQHGHFGGGRT